MIQIKLKTGVFEYDPTKQLGKPGGFGAVYRGKDANGSLVAVKKFKDGLIDYSFRELDIADYIGTQVFQHVMPVFDSGRDAEAGGTFIVMPLAEKSLQDLIDEK